MRAISVLFLLLSMAMAVSMEPRRADFPKDFVFGAGSSAYQVEGAAAEDGRSPSIWDTFTHSGKMPCKCTGDIASNEYHKYEEDVELMKATGLEGYRFSISWTRLIPNGRGKVNPKGLEYYNNLINKLISHGIQPHVTLFHYDHPQVLEHEYGGWLSSKIVDDFTSYADVCFREFGDRVSHWTTLNEPNVFILGGYDLGFSPPGRCSYPFGNCSHGNSVLEPYIVTYNCLLAHSSAVSLYRRKYQAKQKGFIGLNFFMYNFLPLTNSSKDILATRRAEDFYTGFFLSPLVHGDYPESIKKSAGNKVLQFTKNQSKELKGSYDFIGVNYYASAYVQDYPTDAAADQRDLSADMFAVVIPAGFDPVGAPETGKGLQDVLEYLKQYYGNPPTYIQENGYPMPHNGTLDDTPRVKYLRAHISSLLSALSNGSNTIGYFMWSFMDAFELLNAYDASFGLYYVDFEDADRKRYPKLSANWYSNFLSSKLNDTSHSSSSSASPTLVSAI